MTHFCHASFGVEGSGEKEEKEATGSAGSYGPAEKVCLTHRQKERMLGRKLGLRSEGSVGDDRELKGGYLVDPASSHMLVSKIKPCMSKYKLLYTVKLRMAH